MPLKHKDTKIHKKQKINTTNLVEFSVLEHLWLMLAG